VADPPSPDAVSDTLYVPPTLYVFVGFLSLEVVPSPKFQRYDVAFVEVLSNRTAQGAVHPPPVNVNSDVGDGSSFLQAVKPIIERIKSEKIGLNDIMIILTTKSTDLKPNQWFLKVNSIEFEFFRLGIE
jgi:hypothetical protein